MDYKDYYAILGVPRNASQLEIKKAYRTLARRHHPDANTGDKRAEARFKEINEANAALSDPGRRAAYDALGPGGINQARRPSAGRAPGRNGPDQARTGATRPGVRYQFVGGQDSDEFSDFFRSLFGDDAIFGQDPRRTSSQPGRPSRTRTLEDLLRESGASGSDFPRSGGRSAGQRAPATGELEISLAEAYSGTRRLLAVGDRHFELAIPAGIEDGGRIKLSGVAEGADAYLTIRVARHPDFARDRADLARELPITLGEALLGAEVTVPTLHGRLALRIPPETQNGRTFRLRGQGMPRLGQTSHGDLLVKVRVVLPTNLDEGARRSVRALVKRLDQVSPRPGDPIKPAPRRRPTTTTRSSTSAGGS